MARLQVPSVRRPGPGRQAHNASHVNENEEELCVCATCSSRYSQRAAYLSLLVIDLRPSTRLKLAPASVTRMQYSEDTSDHGKHLYTFKPGNCRVIN